ncbi:NAD(P)/FAD-dependent oxidoreductase [Halomarina ordinaria]|uniref:FAD-dependent oxidoreductase n=1 Tax=Halomarina ordinaria TaxID=3033939 RepID=A0ABD5U6W3_9EURY|nr:NAD(P)/FAD-dependent oxidoreductase [Halomarina sp. PSRA2]
MDDTETRDVCIVGGGIAGLTAAIYTARAGLDTVVVSAGESILRRNAHLENVPGFPLGVNPRTFLDQTERQAERAGADVREGEVTDVARDVSGFDVQVDGDVLRADFVLVATKNATDFLADLDVGIIKRGSKTYLDVDEYGRTDVDGLYAAGRVAEKRHQVVVAAGHGADVAMTVVEDAEVPFYHDWVVPEGYFTDRGREVPPGCVELSDDAREERERASMAAIREAFADPHPDDPTPHPSLADEE